MEQKKRLFPPFYRMGDSVSRLYQYDDFGQYNTDFDVRGERYCAHFVYRNPDAQKTIIFIHGSPGNWKGWARYLSDPEIARGARLIAVDRAGYGGSNYGRTGASLGVQAELIYKSILEKFSDMSSVIIVGHSYGGPLALKLASKYPEFVSRLILLAPAISPAVTGIRWYNYLVRFPFIKPFVPQPLHTSNDEMFLLKGELRKLKMQLPSIHAPIDILQGDKDWIVSPENVEFAKQAFGHTDLRVEMIENGSHFIPWEYYNCVKDLILKHIRK